MTAHTRTTIIDGKQCHAVSKEVVGLSREIIDFSADPMTIANGDTDTIQLIKVPAGTLVYSVEIFVETAEGDAITGEVGDGDDIDGWFDGAVAELNLNSATLQCCNGAFCNSMTTAKGKYYSAEDTIDLVIVNSSGSAYTLDAAKIHVFMKYAQK